MDFLGIFLNKEDIKPLYYQLYSALVAKIQAGALPAGKKLPGKRTAAALLGLSVNTVDEAYQMLAAEGFVEAVPRSGFFVCKLGQVLPLPHTKPAQNLPQSFGTVPPKWRHSFASGDLDHSLFPKKMWNRLFKEVLAGEDGLFAKGESQGDEVLRLAIAEYLQGYRGVRCTPQQIVVGAGLEVLTAMISRLLGASCFALENPGYPKVGQILANSGFKTTAIDVDEDGMCPNLLLKSGAQVAYLTPSHQYPTGGVMRLARRTQLILWASAGQRYIIEDDYDSEFRFDGRPLPCMQGLNQSGRVVYAGTFSRSLAAGIRAAYLVLPENLLYMWKKSYGNYACTVSRPEQHTLAKLMQEGHFAQSINRVRSAYRKRRDALMAQLALQLKGQEWRLENTHTGLYFVLRLNGQNAEKIAQNARANGICIFALNEYLTDKKSPVAKKYSDALLLGYGGLAEEEIEKAAGALAACLVPSTNPSSF